MYLNTRRVEAMPSEWLIQANHSCGLMQEDFAKKFADGKSRVLVVTDFSAIRDCRFLCKLVIQNGEWREDCGRVSQMPPGSMSSLFLTKIRCLWLENSKRNWLAPSVPVCEITEVKFAAQKSIHAVGTRRERAKDGFSMGRLERER